MGRPAETSLDAAYFGTLERTGEVPLYQQLAARLESAVADGTLPAGTRLENEVSMASRLGISRPTARQAIQTLVDKGLLVRRRGIGTQVVQRPVARRVDLTSLNDDLVAGGLAPRTELLEHEVRPATEAEARHLDVDEGATVLALLRLRFAGNRPLAVMHNVLPGTFTDLTAAELGEHGLYELLRERGVSFSVARQTIGARSAEAREAALLRLDSGAPVLTMARVAIDHNGDIIEWGTHCYRPDLYSFETTLVSHG